MVITIYSTDSPFVIEEKLKNILTKKDMLLTKKFDANKFCDILKIDEDPVKLQRKWRDEWER